jgi:hypothetical protein
MELLQLAESFASECRENVLSQVVQVRFPRRQRPLRLTHR